MFAKISAALLLIVLSVPFAGAQDRPATERLPQGLSYTGDNTLHLEVTTPQRPYSYTFPNMVARLDRRREQFMLAIPTLEPDLADPTVLDTMTPEEQAFLEQLVQVDRANPIIIRIFFPDAPLDLDDLNDEPITMGTEVEMGGRRYPTTAQVQGYWQEDQLLISFSLMVDNTRLGTPPQTVEELQLFAQGVRLSGIPGYR